MRKITTFKDRLEELIKEKGITTYKLAVDLNIPKTTMSEYSKGKYDPKLENLYKIANYFGVNYMWLLGWDAEKIVTTSTRQEIDTILDGMNEKELKTVNKILKALIEKD